MMRRRTILIAAAWILVAIPAWAQQPTDVPRIAYLSAAASFAEDWRVVAFRDGLKEFGYVEDRNIRIEYFFSPSFAELPIWAQRAVDMRPDVIVAINTVGARAVQAITTEIPVVFAAVAAPVLTGLVESLARPGGNITGPSLMTPDSSGKRLQLLRDLIPGLRRVSVFYIEDSAYAAAAFAPIPAAAKVFGIEISAMQTPGDILDRTYLSSLMARAKETGAQALHFVNSVQYQNVIEIIAELSLEYRLPAVYDFREFADAGGLVSFGANLTETHHRAAYYVDRILKGAKPADLPVEQPTVFDLIINLRTAETLGITVPPALLIQATELIE